MSKQLSEQEIQTQLEQIGLHIKPDPEWSNTTMSRLSVLKESATKVATDSKTKLAPLKERLNLYFTKAVVWAKQNKRAALAMGFTAIVLLFGGVGLILNGLGGRGGVIEQEAQFFSVLGAVPNQFSAPHPVMLPITVQFNRTTEIDLQLLKRNITLTPRAEFEVTISTDNEQIVNLEPVVPFEENTQYQVVIKAGNYGGELILAEDYEYYFFTQGKNSGQVGPFTVVWPDSYYNEEHEYVYSDYVYLEPGNSTPEVGGQLEARLYTSDVNTMLEYLQLILSKPFAGYGEQGRIKNIPAAEKITELTKWTVQKDVQDLQYGQTISIKTVVPAKEPGVYFMSLHNPDGSVYKSNFVVISKTGIATQNLRDKTIVFAQDLQTATKLPSLEITNYVITGSLDPDKPKDLEKQATFSTNQDGLYSIQGGVGLLVYANENDVAILNNDYSLTPMFAKVSANEVISEAFIITDRNLYQPGEVIQYKIVARRLADDIWLPFDPSGTTLEFTTFTVDGEKKLGSYPVTFTGNGSAFGSIQIPAGTKDLGYHSLTFKQGNTYIGHRSVEVSNYEKPLYEIQVTSDKKIYQLGETAKVKLQVTYYSGSPAGSTPITVYTSGGYRPYISDVDSACVNTWQSVFPTLNMDFSRTLITGADGIAEFDLPITAETANGIGAINLRAVISDGTATIANGGVNLEFFGSSTQLQVDAPYSAPTDTEFTIQLDSIDTSCATTQPVDVDVTVKRITYDFVEDGTAYGSYTRKEEEVAGYKMKTNSNDATKRVSFTQQGSYEFTYTFKDSQGRTVKHLGYTWIYDESAFDGIYDPNGYRRQISFKFDKQEYNVGEEATVTIFNPGIRGDALFTVSRSEFREVRVVSLDEYSTQVKFLVTDRMVDRAQISVGIFVNNMYATYTDTLRVNLDYKEINVSVGANKPTYEPGESIQVNISGQNRGRGVQTDYVVAVVDKASIALGNNWIEKLIDKFYTNNSWYSYSYNSLTPINNSPTGGMGGGGDTSLGGDTIYWNPQLVSNANGDASFSFVAPERLTTWTILVWAVGQDATFGESYANVRVNLPITAYTYLPSQLVVGDQARLESTIVNNTDTTQNVTATINFNKPAVSLTSGGNSQSVTVAANSSSKIFWPITANSVDSDISVTFTATGNSKSHITTSTTNVRPKGQQFVQSLNFTESGTKEFTIASDASAVELTISPQAQVTAHTVKALNYLISYPYDFSEQISSKIIANSNLLINPSVYVPSSGLNVPTAEETKARINKGLNQLYSLQGSAGGMPWAYGRPDNNVELVAYSLLAAHYAEQAGVSVKPDFKSKAISFLEATTLQGNDTYAKAIGLYALSIVGRNVSAAMPAATNEGLNPYTPAEIALLSLAAHHNGNNALANQYLDVLTSQGVDTAGMLMWASTSDIFYSSSTANAAGIALSAYSKQGRTTEATKIVNWLNANKTDGYWSTTNATLFTLQGIVDYNNLVGAQQTNLSYSILVDGAEVMNGAINTSGSSSTVSVPISPLVMTGLSSGNHTIQVDISGTGTFFVNAVVKQFSNQDLRSEPLDGTMPFNNIAIRRQITNAQGQAVTSLKVGEFGMLKVELDNRVSLRYLRITNFVPAGLEVIDRTLVSNQIPVSMEWFRNYSGVSGTPYINRTEVSIFVDSLSSMQNNVVYIPVRARTAGTYEFAPTEVEALYAPQLWSTTSASRFTITN